MKAPYSHIPAVPVAIGFGGGILSGIEGYGVACIIVGITIATALIITHRLYFSFIAAAMTLGAISGTAARLQPIDNNLIGHRLYVRGEVRELCRYSNSTRIIVDADSYSHDNHRYTNFTDTRISIVIPAVTDSITPGDRLMFYGRLSQTGEALDLPFETDYSSFDIVNGVNAHARVSPDNISVVGKGYGITAFIARIHTSVQDLIFSLPVKSETAWFLAAVMLGDDSMLGVEIKESFRATGLAHMLALSGFHTGIIAFFASIILSGFKLLKRGSRYRHTAVIAAVWLFAVMTGLTASVVRAATVITIMLAARILQRDTSPYNTLAIAALVILSAAPRQIYSPGFQLSFTAVLSILVFARRLNPVNERRRILYPCVSLFTVSISAVIGTALLTAFYFHRLPLLFLIPNVVMAALMPVITGLGIIMIPFSAIGLNPEFLGQTCDSLYSLGLWITTQFASFDPSETDCIFLNPTFIIAAYTTLIIASVAFVRRRHIAAASLTATIAIAAVSCSSARRLPSAELYITRHYLHTEIIMRHDDRCIMLSTAKEHMLDDIRIKAESKYKDFLAHRRCPGHIHIETGDFRSGPFRHIGDRLVAGAKSITIAHRESRPPTSGKTDYLLMCRGYRHDFLTLLNAVSPDTVLLSADLPEKQFGKYKSACDSAGIPSRNITQSRFSIILD